MRREKPFSATFKLEKETKNTVRYAEEAAGRGPVVGTVYFDKLNCPSPFPIKFGSQLNRRNSGWNVDWILAGEG